MPSDGDRDTAGTPQGPPRQALEEARDWLVRLASGEMGPHDHERLQAWLQADPAHRSAFDREQAMWRQAEGLEDAFGPSTWGDAGEPADSLPEPRRLRSARSRLGRRSAAMGLVGALAACLLLVVLGGDIRLWLTADHRTGAGEQRQIALPDGSVVHLNTDSAVEVDYGAKARRVALLRGEAYFDVARNPARPFVVLARDRSVRAVGTAFAVRVDADTVSVTVTSGEIEVAPLARAQGAGGVEKPVGVVATQQLVYRGGGTRAAVTAVDTRAALGWREGRIVIDEMPFGRAIAELDRYWPGRIVVASRRRLTAPVSGVFSPARLGSALGALAATQGLKVQYLTLYLVILY